VIMMTHKSMPSLLRHLAALSSSLFGSSQSTGHLLQKM